MAPQTLQLCNMVRSKDVGQPQQCGHVRGRGIPVSALVPTQHVFFGHSTRIVSAALGMSSGSSSD